MCSNTVCSFLILIIFLPFGSIDCLTNSDNASFAAYSYVVQVTSHYLTVPPGMATGTGIVITPKCAITVAHITIGSNYTLIQQGLVVFRAKAIHSVPGYNLSFPPLIHDICVIELTKPIPTMSNIKPCPTRTLYRTSLSPGTELTALVARSGVVPVSMALQKGNVQVVPNDSEPRNWPEMQLWNRTDFFLMKGNTPDGKPIVAEGGDSGGVLMIAGIFCGLINFGGSNANLGQPSGCLNISNYNSWFKSEIEQISPGYLHY